MEPDDETEFDFSELEDDDDAFGGFDDDEDAYFDETYREEDDALDDERPGLVWRNFRNRTGD